MRVTVDNAVLRGYSIGKRHGIVCWHGWIDDVKGAGPLEELVIHGTDLARVERMFPETTE